MAFGRQKPIPSESDSGIKEELASFAQGVKSYVGARGELFALEGREAAKIYRKKAGLAGLAIVLSIFGYLFLLIALVGIIGQWLHPNLQVNLKNWSGAALLIGGLHLVAGILLLMKQKKTGQGDKVFEITLAELRKDQEWLRNENEN